MKKRQVSHAEVFQTNSVATPLQEADRAQPPSSEGGLCTVTSSRGQDGRGRRNEEYYGGDIGQTLPGPSDQGQRQPSDKSC